MHATFKHYLVCDIQTVNMSLVCPASAITYAVQLITVLCIVVTALVNLSLEDTHKDVWLVLLSSSLGFIFPNPTLKKKKPELVPRDG
jgi:hypothetical protein